MKFPIIVVNVVAVVSINGQFLEAEFSVGSVPLNLRRNFEIRQSVGREIQNPADTTRSSSQGRRHIDNQRNIRNGPNRNVNNFDIGQDQSEFQNNEQVPLNRRLVNYRGQSGNNDDQLNSQAQEVNLANVFTNNRQSIISRNTEANEFSNQNVALSNQDAYTQRDNPSNDRAYESYSNQQNAQQNANRRQDAQNEYVSSNVRTSTTRTILKNSQNGGRVQIDSKSAQDNELSNRPKSDEKWVWTDEPTTKSTPTIIPTVDDRAAFTGDQCPTGKVKFNNSCVEKD